MQTLVRVRRRTLLCFGGGLVLAGCDAVAPQELNPVVRWANGPDPLCCMVEIEVAVPPQPYRRIQGQIPGSLEWEEFEGSSWFLPASSLPNGESELSVRVLDEPTFWWSSEWSGTVAVAVDRKAPELTVRGAKAGQGRTAEIWVESTEPLVDPRITVFEKERALHEVDGRYRAFVGIPLREDRPSVGVIVNGSDAAGNQANLATRLVVEPVEYPVGGYIRLSKKQVDARGESEAMASMRKQRDDAYALQRPEQLWDGAFIDPVVGRRTSPFGKYRSYSDGRKSYHTGIDIANASGTPVVASARGEVVVANEMAIFGNAVVMHHGQGVTTSYNHLSRIDCEVGDILDAGDPVGLLGSTGQSTGPHLHFSMVVGEEAVDPSQWLEGLGAP